MAGASPRPAVCPVQLHFGEQDPHIPLTDVEAIRQANPGVEVFTYASAGHGFCCDARGSYHAESEALARSRVLAFLRNRMS
jgi:carboxymethylenebutenolidase